MQLKLDTDRQRIPASGGRQSDGLAANGGLFVINSLAMLLDETENRVRRPGNPGNVGGKRLRARISGIIKMTIARTTLAMLVLAGVFASSPSGGATLEVGPSKTYKTPSAAAAVAKNGDHIKIRPAENFDCAVWTAAKLGIAGPRPACA